MAQQTSVEWLIEKLEESGIPLLSDELEMIEQAKEMHKQQTKDAYNQGYVDSLEDVEIVECITDVLIRSNAENYYNEIFFKNK
jgi:hypothetical protein